MHIIHNIIPQGEFFRCASHHHRKYLINLNHQLELLKLFFVVAISEFCFKAYGWELNSELSSISLPASGVCCSQLLKKILTFKTSRVRERGKSHKLCQQSRFSIVLLLRLIFSTLFFSELIELFSAFPFCCVVPLPLYTWLSWLWLFVLGDDRRLNNYVDVDNEKNEWERAFWTFGQEETDCVSQLSTSLVHRCHPFIFLHHSYPSFRRQYAMRAWKKRCAFVRLVWVMWTKRKFEYFSFHFIFSIVLEKLSIYTNNNDRQRRPKMMMMMSNSNSNRAIVVSIKIDFVSRMRRIKWSYKVA